jgi:hypothetical protein
MSRFAYPGLAVVSLAASAADRLYSGGAIAITPTYGGSSLRLHAPRTPTRRPVAGGTIVRRSRRTEARPSSICQISRGGTVRFWTGV